MKTFRGCQATLHGALAVWMVGGAIFLQSGCATTPPGQNTAAGAGIGALLGGATGAVAGNNVKGISKTEGAVAGAIVGGLLGGVMGNQRDATERQNASVNQRLDSMNQEMNTAVINVVNSNGSMTPVIMHKSGNQWVGPRGEMYSSMPTPDQLKPVYGF